jgi:hypothetical protein
MNPVKATSRTPWFDIVMSGNRWYLFLTNMELQGGQEVNISLQPPCGSVCAHSVLWYVDTPPVMQELGSQQSSVSWILCKLELSIWYMCMYVCINVCACLYIYVHILYCYQSPKAQEITVHSGNLNKLVLHFVTRVLPQHDYGQVMGQNNKNNNIMQLIIQVSFQQQIQNDTKCEWPHKWFTQYSSTSSAALFSVPSGKMLCIFQNFITKYFLPSFSENTVKS